MRKRTIKKTHTRAERFLQRPLTLKERTLTPTHMPLGLLEYRAFFLSCFLTPKMKYRQSFTGKNLSWRKHLVDGRENWLMVWLIGEITGRMFAGKDGEKRWRFFSNDDDCIDFHNAMECFLVYFSRDRFPEVSEKKYYEWRKECIKIGLIMPVHQFESKYYINPNFFVEKISKKKKWFILERLQNNLIFTPIKEELMSYLLGKSKYKIKSSIIALGTSYFDLVSIGYRPVYNMYLEYNFTYNAIYPKKGLDLPIANLISV